MKITCASSDETMPACESVAPEPLCSRGWRRPRGRYEFGRIVLDSSESVGPFGRGLSRSGQSKRCGERRAGSRWFGRGGEQVDWCEDVAFETTHGSHRGHVLAT